MNCCVWVLLAMIPFLWAIPAADRPDAIAYGDLGSILVPIGGQHIAEPGWVASPRLSPV